MLKKVALGMSGGVDSSLCAYLLKEAGYEVTGVYLECWRAPGCRTEEDRQDALKVALELGIPFQVLDFKQQYKDRVVENFFTEYEAGRTPNPDVLCNKEIKFGLFYDWAMEHGFEYVATGHYARVGVGDSGLETVQGSKIVDHDGLAAAPENGKASDQSGDERDQAFLHPAAPASHPRVLCTSADPKKDQTYFLYRLRTDQLSHILFPIGHLTKAEVRAEAKQRNIPVAQKPDSQGICFIGEINVHNFLRERLGEHPGEVVNTKGEVIGKHQGLWFYTIGQRHGFEISGTWKSAQGELKHAMPPYYVIAKVPDTNSLVVGFGEETYRDSFGLVDLHWIGGEKGDNVGGEDEQGLDEKTPLRLPSLVPNLFVRIRHGGKLIKVRQVQHTRDFLNVELDEAVQGIAEGQSAVFYALDQESSTQEPVSVCLGGGVISG